MELPEEVTSTPGRTPGSLMKQSAHRLAHQLIETTLPAITEYWDGEIKLRKYRFTKRPVKTVSDKRSLIKHLQSVLQWYRTNECLSSHGSNLRQHVGVACADALTYLLPADEYEPLFLLTIQIMFCLEAGFISQSREVYDSKESRSFAEFLRFLAPFSLETIYTTCINFRNCMPISVLIKNSPYLRDIHIYKNLTNHVLTQLRKHCPNIESVTLSGHNVVSEEYLFKAFFGGKDKNHVINHIDFKEQLKLSFPKLKSVNILMDLENDDIMFFLQHFYPNIKTYWTKSIAETKLTPTILKSLLDPPLCLQGKGNYQLDTVEFTVRITTLENWDKSEPSLIYPAVKHVSIFHTYQELSDPEELSEKIKDIVERLRCTSFSHSSPLVEDYLDTLSVCVPILETSGSSLSELHLSTYEVVDARVLFKCLDMCPCLSVFSVHASRIEVDAGFPIVGLNKLPKLKSLGMSVKSLNASEMSFIDLLIQAAPNLKTIELFGANLQSALQDLVDSGVLSKIQILSLHKSISWFTGQDEQYCIYLGENLCSLSVLMLNPILRYALFQIKSHFTHTQLKVIHRYKMLIS